MTLLIASTMTLYIVSCSSIKVQWMACLLMTSLICFFVGSERDLGIYAELLPAVLYKRGDMSDWAQFCNIFGMPVREYTYDAGDEEARRRVIADARRQGANAAYIHPKESELKLVEAGNKTGSSDFIELLLSTGTQRCLYVCWETRSLQTLSQQERRHSVLYTRRKRTR